MLSRALRFHGHGGLRYVFKHGETVRSRLFNVRYTLNKFRPHSRYGVSVSKKVVKSAVGRNRIRRRVYEILRGKVGAVSVTCDVVFIVVSPDVMTMDHEELSLAVETCLRDAKLLT